MADGVTIIGAGIATTGITLFGISTGLDPSVLIAGFAGGVWAQSYYPPTHWAKRVGLSALATILAGYLAPAAAAVATSYDVIRSVLPMAALQLPAAVVVGLLAHRVLGPAFMKLAANKVDEVAK